MCFRVQMHPKNSSNNLSLNIGLNLWFSKKSQVPEIVKIQCLEAKKNKVLWNKVFHRPSKKVSWQAILLSCYVVVWLCCCVALWLYICLAVWLCCSVALWLRQKFYHIPRIWDRFSGGPALQLSTIWFGVQWMSIQKGNWKIWWGGISLHYCNQKFRCVV